MVVGIAGLHRQEGARADVERQRFASDPGRAERIEQRGGEVQRRGRRRDRAVLPREHRLVIGPVGFVGPALAGDIGRQRHRARAFEQQLDLLVADKGEDEAAVGKAILGDRRDPRTEVDRFADAQPLGVAHERLPAAQIDTLVQRGADFGVPAMSLKLRRDHACVVEDEAVAGPQPLRQVAHAGIDDAAAIDDQHPRGVARARRAERDALAGQIEVESIDAHGSSRAFPRLLRDRRVKFVDADHGGGRRGLRVGQHRDRGHGLVVGGDRHLHHARHHRGRFALLDRIDILHPRHDPAEGGVAAVEREARLEHDEELAVRAVLALRARHRQRAAQVGNGVELGLEVGKL